MKIFWFDVETGGLDPLKNPIIQLAYVVEIDGVERESGQITSSGFEGCTLEDKALEVNGYTRDQIAEYSTEREMYGRLTKVFEKYVNRFDKNDKFIAAGYNVQFDMKFLREVWNRCGDKYFGSWFFFSAIDPSAIVPFLQYAEVLPELPRLRLIDVAEFFKVSREGAHDAFEDIRMTIDVTKEIMKAVERYYVS